MVSSLLFVDAPNADGTMWYLRSEAFGVMGVYTSEALAWAALSGAANL
jgi:hypothetical protein